MIDYLQKYHICKSSAIIHQLRKPVVWMADATKLSENKLLEFRVLLETTALCSDKKHMILASHSAILLVTNQIFLLILD